MKSSADATSAIVTLTFPPEISEGVAEPTSAMLRPFRILFKDKKNVGNITYVFFNSGVGKSYLVGTLCYTVRKRLLFFPGFQGRKLLWNSSHKGSQLPQGLVDHITAETDLKTSHVTTLLGDKKEKVWMKEFNLLDLSNRTKLWFGISIENLNTLERMPQMTRWVFNGTREEVERESSIVLESRKNAVFSMLQLPQTVENFTEDKFLHLDFFIEKRHPFSPASLQYRIKLFIADLFPRLFQFNKDLQTSAVPSGKPSLTQDMPIRENIETRTHYIKLQGFDGMIVINTSKHPGKLSENAIISSPPQ